MNNPTAAYWIKHLKLQPHPEGGYYKEVFRSEKQVKIPGPEVHRQACTSIYYLLEGADFSGFHCIASDELWYFHQGSPLLIHVIDEQGQHTTIELSDSENGNLSTAISAGRWFAAHIPSAKGFTLVSCAVAPGFEFDEFEMAKKMELKAIYPQHTALLDLFCRR